MGGEILVVVAPGVEMEFVRDVASDENFVESRGTDLKAVVVLVAAIKVNVQTRKIRRTS